MKGCLNLDRSLRDSVELAFAEKSLRQLCESEATAQRVLGERAALKLKGRLADLRAAATVKDLVVGRPQELEGSAMALNLHSGSRMVFSANHHNIPVLKSGCVNWSRVTRVKILRIESCDA